MTGDPARRTGGNLYDRRMVAAMRREGLDVTIVVLGDRIDAARQLAELRVPVVIVDTIAAALAAPQLDGLRRRGAGVIALAHMAQGAVVLARRADTVIAVSRALGRDLVAHGVDRRRIAVISPGRERVVATRRAARAHVVLCVANWTPAKGIHTLVAAVAGLPGVSLELVGDAPDPAYAARVRRDIVTRGLASRVRIRGPLGHGALMRLYAAATIFALPSTREGYPIVLAEALAHGLPIVGSDIAGVREVSGGAAMLVAPGRVRPLTMAIERLLRDDRIYRERARRSVNRARELPTWADSEARFVRAVRSP